MTKTRTFLVAGTALTAAIGVPAWGAMQAPVDGRVRPFAALSDEGPLIMPLVLASDDEPRGRPLAGRRAAPPRRRR
jgi:hypothetical protein